VGDGAPDAALRAVFVDARGHGFLGPDDPQRHIAHAAAFAAAAESVFGPDGPEAFLDLGTGAGVPGLVLATVWPRARATLLDAGQRRCAFVREAAARLGLATRVEVRCDRAEVLGRHAQLRERFPLVTARAFGAPAVTAELGAAFVAVGGVILVSEPPEAPPDRWPDEGLERFGLAPAETWRDAAGMAMLRKIAPLPDRYPRRTGVPAKRPEW
jgi:16S rRNA (guanine527-N7)-methyltransferase